jgi:hypothetical protein
MDEESHAHISQRNAAGETMLYRFCFFDAEEHAAATEELEVPSLIDAMARAHMLLKARPQHETIEVWLGNSLAYRARRDRAAA